MKYFLGVSGLAPLALLIGCGGGGSDGGGVTDTTPTPGSPTVMRLVGDFSIQNDYRLTGKSTVPGTKAEYTNKFAVKGTVEQLVTVSVDTGSGSVTFQPVGTDAMKVSATVSEIGHCETANPNDATVASSLGDSSFSGPVASPVDYTVRASALGAGDEFSLRMAAAAKGSATLTFTAPNGSAQTTTQTCPGLPSILQRPPELAPTEAVLSSTQSWSLFPALGARPSQSADQQLYDAIAQNPSGFHVGLTTSPARDRWSYSGTRVLASTDTALESTRWTETIVLNWQLVKP